MNIGQSSKDTHSFELNLAPIIDCFTVLITYLLVSASFISVGMLDVGVAATKESDEPQLSTIPLTATLELQTNGAMEVKATGGKTNVDIRLPVMANHGERNWAAMKDSLEKLKSRYPELKEVNISATSSTRYQEIVKAIEEAKLVFPKVFLANGEVP